MAAFVLVHGRGSGGWLWDPVATLLHEAGHVVHTPTPIGVGERASEGDAGTNSPRTCSRSSASSRSRPRRRWC
jgi:hypothetical protein